MEDKQVYFNPIYVIKDMYRYYRFPFLMGLLSLILSIIVFDYFDGKAYTTWSVDLWDAVFSGRIREYYIITRESLRGNVFELGTDVFLENLIWGLWNFPLWLTHIDKSLNVNSFYSMLYSKLFLILNVYIASTIIYNIVIFFTKSEKKSSLAAVSFTFSNIVIISIGYSAQNEIFYLNTFLLAIYFILKNKIKLAYIFLVITVTLNPFFLLPSIICIASMTNKIYKIIVYTFFLPIVFILERKFFIIDGIREFDFINWYFGRSILNVGYYSVSLCFIAIFFIIGVYIFDNKFYESKKNIMFYISTFMLIVCLLSWQHFYRFIIYIPFLIISVSIIDDENKCKNLFFLFFMLDVLFSLICFTDINCYSSRYIQLLFKEKLNLNTTNAVVSFFEIIKNNLINFDGLEYLIVSASAVLVFIFIYYILFSHKKHENNIINYKNIIYFSSIIPSLFIIGFIVLVKIYL